MLKAVVTLALCASVAVPALAGAPSLRGHDRAKAAHAAAAARHEGKTAGNAGRAKAAEKRGHGLDKLHDASATTGASTGKSRGPDRSKGPTAAPDQVETAATTH